MRAAILAALVALVEVACQGRDIARIPTGGGSTGSNSGATSGGVSSSTSASSSGTGSSAFSSGTTGTSAGTGTGGSTSTGTTTGSPYWDGGYVYCSLAFAADGGMNGDGGPATWLCQPGSYFCDTSGNLGNCFQCLSDADCANQALPTYDSARPRCDLDSGIEGYQNHCQVCLTSSDCTRNPAGPFCNLQVGSYDELLEPPTEDFGFETCGLLVEDCRVDGGPSCNVFVNEFCDSSNGRCEFRTGSCVTDQDCDGFLDPNTQNLLLPVCLEERCETCDGGTCPKYECTSDADCGGFFPACVNGYCSCDGDDQCGDGGLKCIPPYASLDNIAFCGVSCTAAGFPPCGLDAYGSYTPICNSSTGVCEHCTSDQQCQNEIDSHGPRCLSGGECGCTTDSDCASGEACQRPTERFYETCLPRPQRCSIESCFGYWCDWQTGECADDGAVTPGHPCHDDYDCSHGWHGDDFCNAKTGCAPCRNDADCEHHDGGYIAGHNCFAFDDAGDLECGCTSDEGCAGISAGSRCDTDAGDPSFRSCGCLTSADCAPGLACQSAGQFTTCTSSCSTDDDCQTNFYCAPDRICRSRCDPGHSCQNSDPLCDTMDVAGENADGGAVWCFACLSAADCPASQGCSQLTHACGGCSQSTDCRAGEICTPAHACQPTCAQGGCPVGEVCDTENTAGGGYDVCYQCLNPANCPGDEGCNSETHTCGSCFPQGWSVYTTRSDCPPDDICSAFWSDNYLAGVCLPNCDRISCPADKPICAVLPALTPDHHYCFGCLTDADCAGDSPGTWCDVSVNMTFSCQPP